MGPNIIGQHGREVGVITDMLADIETWQVQSLELKLNRETRNDLKLKKPWFRIKTVQVPIGEISGASETEIQVLKSLLEKMELYGGKPAVYGLPTAEGE